MSAPVQAVDAAAEALAKSRLKCHAVDKKKDAILSEGRRQEACRRPATVGEDLAQITTGQKVKLEDGTEEEHKTVKSKDQAAVSNMIQWILSLK